MKNFLVVTNQIKDPDKSRCRRVIKTLEDNGCVCTASIYAAERSSGKYLLADPADVPENTQAILVLGGDGTFLHAAKDLLELNLPIVGIYFGTLGFLTEIKPDNFEQALRSIINGNYTIENRMLLEGEIIKNGKTVYTDQALNDIVLNRSSTSGLIHFDVNVNGGFLNSYSADGMVVSTPTGSTGYNLSAGGPVVQPTAQIILATPICAHALNSRSIVFSADIEISLIARAKAGAKELNTIVSFDGEKDIPLADGDIVKIKKAEQSVRLIKINDFSFIENISKNMR